jgi:hypothetical protein
MFSQFQSSDLELIVENLDSIHKIEFLIRCITRNNICQAIKVVNNKKI